MDYERVGQFIYGAYRHGAVSMDLENWMADELGVPRVASGNDRDAAKLMTAFFARLQDNGQLQDSYERFIAALTTRQP